MKISNAIQRAITGTALTIIFLGTFLYLPPLYFSLLLAVILLYIIIYEWKNLFAVNSLAFWLLLPFYPILPFIFLILMNHDPAYRPLLLILFIIIPSFDTGSYIAGKLFGKHKLAPTISPGKTWEGFVGGLIFAFIVLLLMLWGVGNTKTWWLLGSLTLIICTLGLCGDIFESWLKRRASIKDSGSILPGHGGFLDRFDSILFVSFFLYLFKKFLILLIK